MPDRFRRGHGPKEENTIPGGGNFHGGGDLWGGIIEKLDHLENLGINALYLTPIFASMTYHRYDITDYFRVDERLGGEAAFVKLIGGELRKRGGIRLVLDGVFHHTSFFHPPYFQDVVKKGEESEYKGFYRITGFPVVSREFMEILNSGLPLTEKYIKLKKLDWNYESFYSVWLMPRLNHDNPEVRRFIGGRDEALAREGGGGRLASGRRPRRSTGGALEGGKGIPARRGIPLWRGHGRREAMAVRRLPRHHELPALRPHPEVLR